MKVPRDPIKKIILVTDFTDACKDASHHAMIQAQTYKAELKALYVFEPRTLGISEETYLPSEHFVSNEDPEKTRQRGIDFLKELADSFDMKVETIFAEGIAGREIVRITSDLKTDLIVLGAQSYTGWNRFVSIPGSVAEHVVKYAPCAVLAIRQNNLDKNYSPSKTEYRSKKKETAGTLH
jgi:nucleotide-binding universal stress UspA family protein